MSYILQFTPEALDDLEKIDRKQAQRIVKKLMWLAEAASFFAHYRMTGDWSDYHRLRIGDYRVIYALDDGIMTILVVKIGHRREIYDE